jgi:hypothetical protein
VPPAAPAAPPPAFPPAFLFIAADAFARVLSKSFSWLWKSPMHLYLEEKKSYQWSCDGTLY